MHLFDAIEYIYKEHCCNEQGSQYRRIVGVGISMGASILGQYAIKAGTKNRLDAQVGIGCMFFTKQATDFMKKTCFGIYDIVLGLGLKMMLGEHFAQYDKLKKKTHPDSNLLQRNQDLYYCH